MAEPGRIATRPVQPLDGRLNTPWTPGNEASSTPT